MRDLRWSHLSIKKQPSDNPNDNVGKDLPPNHVNISRPKRIAIPPRLLDSLPYCQQAEAECEASRQSCKLVILDSSRHSGDVLVNRCVGNEYATEGNPRQSRQAFGVQGIIISLLVPKRGASRPPWTENCRGVVSGY